MNDVNNYKKYINIADIILFDSKGYEKSLGFNHSFLSNVPKIISKFENKIDYCNGSCIIE